MKVSRLVLKMNQIIKVCNMLKSFEDFRYIGERGIGRLTAKKQRSTSLEFAAPLTKPLSKMQVSDGFPGLNYCLAFKEGMFMQFFISSASADSYHAFVSFLLSRSSSLQTAGKRRDFPQICLKTKIAA